MQRSNKQTVVAVVLLVCLVALVGLINKMSSTVATARPGQSSAKMPPPPTPAKVDAYWKDILVISPAGPRGAASAQFSLVEFGDFQCPQCGKIRPEVERAIDGSAGHLNLYFVQRPFPTIHRYALAASQAAVFAAKHGKFWQMYDTLYSHQDDLEPGNYDDYAKAIGLDGDSMRKAIEGHQYAGDVDRSSELGDAIGIRETPTVGLRDNRTGKFVWIVEGRDDIDKALAKADWMKTTQTASTTRSPGGS